MSLSKDTYETKEQITAAIERGEKGKQLRIKVGLAEKISFRKVDVTPSQLLCYALEGYTFCALFSNFGPNTGTVTYVKADGCFTMSGKADEFFDGSYFVGVDIDETRYSSTEELIRKLRLCPTFWYTSLSNQQVDSDTGECKGVRMRLIYVFNAKIEDKYFFRYCSYMVHAQIESDLQECIKDKCGMRCSQYFNGTNRKHPEIKLEYDDSGVIYSLSDFGITNQGYLDFLYNKCNYNKLTQKQRKDIKERICLISSQADIKETTNNTNNINLGIIQTATITKIRFSDALIKDNVTLPWDDFYKRYIHQYRYVYRTEKDNWLTFDNNILYQVCGLDYIELPWIPQMLTDGHHRRSTLFHRAWLRRVICPNISPDELLFNLFVDRERFFDNSDGVISNRLLIKKVRESFETPINTLIDLYKDFFSSVLERSSKKKLILHYSSRGRINANHLRKELRWQLLDNVYDTTLTVEDNLIILNDEVLEIGRSTIYRYLHDRGIEKRNSRDVDFEKFCLLHQEGLSLRQERDFLKSHGLYLSLNSISSYRNRITSKPNVS